MNIDDILPGPTDRAAIIGQTGSGKTFLARVLLERRDYCVVYDPKGMIKWPGWEVHTRLAEAQDSESQRIVYKPTYDELASVEMVERFFEWIYKRGRTTCYVDEVFAICHNDQYPWYYGACLTRGRERGICIFTATQRPSRIPAVCLSESEKMYCFYLKLDKDRERVEEMTGIDADELFELKKHRFYYAPQDGKATGPIWLNLHGYNRQNVKHATSV